MFFNTQARTTTTDVGNITTKQALQIAPAVFTATPHAGVFADQLIKDVDALILATEWNLFRQPDFEVMERTMKHKIIFDGRNQYDPRRLREKGWEYVGIGR